MAPAADALEISLVAWSIVHGYASLYIEAGLEGEKKRGQQGHLFAHTFEALRRVPLA